MSIASQFGIVPFDSATLISLLGDYKSAKDKVSSLEKKGEIIRIRKNLYVNAPQLVHVDISKQLLANHIYGPSYISFQTALALYGLIPERVVTYYSASTKRKKQFTTPFGTFEYRTIPQQYFSIGITQNIIEHTYTYLIASPEKALCDTILLYTHRIQSKKAMFEYLIEDMRIDFSALHNLRLGIVNQCIEYGYKKRN
ncbi:MAG: hypothetical protein GX277_01725 [Bacteroidales bacterium]|nr:hypothetical protein [Bacteroidales bacterium]